MTRRPIKSVTQTMFGQPTGIPVSYYGHTVPILWKGWEGGARIDI